MTFPSAAWDWCKSNILQVNLEDQEWDPELHSISLPAPRLGKQSQAGLTFPFWDGRAPHDVASPC